MSAGGFGQRVLVLKINGRNFQKKSFLQVKLNKAVTMNKCPLTRIGVNKDVIHSFVRSLKRCLCPLTEIRMKCYSVVTTQAWLIKENSQDEGAGACASSLAFSRSAPVPVKNILTRVLSEEHAQTGDTSNTPCFHICSEFYPRMRVEILILSKGFDCRLSIRTCKKYYKEKK